jgi:hypothetical protein
LAQKSQPFGYDFIHEVIDARGVATGMCEAGDETEFNRIVWNGENDRDLCGRSFGGKRRPHIAWRGDHVDPMANQLGC